MTRILGLGIKGQHPYVTALFYCKRLGIDGEPIKFIVDTGTLQTTLTETTAKRIGIDTTTLFKEKPHQKIGGIGGSADGYRLGDVYLVFDSIDGVPAEERLQYVLVMKPPKPRDEKERKALELIPDLLGLDVIRQYALHFDGNAFYMEK